MWTVCAACFPMKTTSLSAGSCLQHKLMGTNAAYELHEEDRMANELHGKKVAILVENGFEQAELTGPKEALDKAGAQTSIVSPQAEKVKGWQHAQWGDEFPVDVPLDKADPSEFDALLLPGGVMNPDKLRINKKAVAFVRRFFDDRKPVAAICHAPWTLIEAGVVAGRRVTSWPSVSTDLKNAGANWVDEQVVQDGGLVTSRKPEDIPAFNKAVLQEFSRTPAGRH